MQDSVTVQMSASPERIWELVSDVTLIGRYSPETFEAEWTGGSSGPAVGAIFRGHVKRNGRGPTYWTPCKVIACEPGREFGFSVMGGKDKPINTWRYTMKPSADGTAVTESFELSQTLPLRAYWAVMGRWRGRTNRTGMLTTLESIKKVVEQDAAARGE